MKVIEQYFHVVLFSVPSPPFRVCLQNRDHPHRSYQAERSHSVLFCELKLENNLESGWVNIKHRAKTNVSNSINSVTHYDVITNLGNFRLGNF